MANKALMLNCPACNHQVSSSAFTCPSCGAVLRKAKRGLFGKLAIWAFWGFNLLMVLWIWGGTKAAIEGQQAMTGAEAAGAAIGTGIGVTMLIVLWLIGAVILGLMALLTRPKH